MTVSWKDMNSAPRSGKFIVMRAGSGYIGTKYQLKVGHYVASRASQNSEGFPFDWYAWRDHCGNYLSDDGPLPDAWCELEEIGL